MVYSGFETVSQPNVHTTLASKQRFFWSQQFRNPPKLITKKYSPDLMAVFASLSTFPVSNIPACSNKLTGCGPFLSPFQRSYYFSNERTF